MDMMNPGSPIRLRALGRASDRIQAILPGEAREAFVGQYWWM
jgi:hypothetical protein